MFYTVFIFFLLFLSNFNSLASEELCNSNILNNNEDFYRKVLSSSDDPRTIREYVIEQGECFKEGVNLIEVRGVPLVEIFDCSSGFKDNKSEYFFKNGKLCLKTVRFFPSRNVFLFTGTASHINSMEDGWEKIRSRNAILFYRKNHPFRELQNVEGRILNLSERSLFTNEFGRPVYPYFVFKEGKWRNVSPLRELFELTVRDDSSFDIKIITESRLSYDKDEIIETIGLKASVFQVETPEPCRYLISGSNILGVRIPRFAVFEQGSSYHGSYIIRLSYDGIKPEQPKIFSENSFEIKIIYEQNMKEVKLNIFSKKLSKAETNKIRAIISEETPPFYVIKKDAE